MLEEDDMFHKLGVGPIANAGMLRLLIALTRSLQKLLEVAPRVHVFSVFWSYDHHTKPKNEKFHNLTNGILSLQET